ncbi:tRNA modification GTPase MnmE [Buchnera aphidicola (Sipha maydis)]|uniref:tRNA uridine-5-carboxymethylaminomethyl(34) synthesis GTPase MnmE n=1 Tax=Buchnera aphidicola TaxID=9 RepID=UPI0025433A5C|nr:tRNA uridine-5-carboxymethylaminomethyl(34) synthesis GTPase MnmE [Buchnera aphidicola]WII23699.1 tRNA uridine-5-carboxymethylaminomethyl(34) synthesis GTPase MnmE [Buchnera aphidicola (Sipha maydis)]
MSDTTIVAQVTPQGNGGVYIVRISGKKSHRVSLDVLGKFLKPRYASYVKFFDVNSEVLDQGIGIWFPAPNSYTGEDVLELQGHGNSYIVKLLIKRILKIPGIRIARPGEFSERAFLNDKIDLTQAESIIDLINASSESAVKASLKSLNGSFSDKIKNIINKVVDIRVMLESELNFSEEEDLNINFKKKFLKKIKNIINCLDNLLCLSKNRKIIQNGIKVVIAGFPNTGKSSFFNLLSCKKFSIVTNIKGTTRDLIHNKIYFNKFLIELTDTAGIRRTQNKVEKIGISLAKKEIYKSEILFFLIDITKNKNDQLKKFFKFIQKLPSSITIILICNKIDLTNIPPHLSIYKNIHCIYMSIKKKIGLDIFIKYFKKILKKYNYDVCGENFFLARQRHLEEIILAKKELILGKKEWKKNKNYEVIAYFLQNAQNALNRVTGKIFSRDILNKIFSRFCIGK